MPHQVLKIVGTLFGVISVSAFAAAGTYAVGRLFVAHFESGGTLLDLDVERARTSLRHHSADHDFLAGEQMLGFDAVLRAVGHQLA